MPAQAQAHHQETTDLQVPARIPETTGLQAPAAHLQAATGPAPLLAAIRAVATQVAATAVAEATQAVEAAAAVAAVAEGSHPLLLRQSEESSRTT